MDRLLYCTLLFAVLGRHVVAQPDAEAVAAMPSSTSCINGALDPATKTCACQEGYSGVYPDCQFCPEPQTSVLAPDGSRNCTCPAAKGLVPSSTGDRPCKCAAGLYPGSPVTNNPDIQNLCSKCTQVGTLVVAEEAEKVCGCNNATGYGFSAFLLYLRTKEWPQSYCIPCSTGNKQLDAQGVCRCKPGFGIWGNVGPNATDVNYCRACQGPEYMVDQYGWCRCAAGYAVDPRTDACTTCQGIQFTQMPQEGGSMPWNLLQCACATGYVSATEATGPMLCKKCEGLTTARSAVVSKKRQCVCKDPQKTDPPTCSVCKFGYAANADGWCKRLPECGQVLKIQVWPKEQLPVDWSGDAFPDTLISNQATPSVSMNYTSPISFQTAEQWEAAHIPWALISSQFAARIHGCLCATYKSGSALWAKVANQLTVDVSAAEHSVAVSVGEQTVEPEADSAPGASSTAQAFKVDATCVQVDVRVWSAAEQLSGQLKLDLVYQAL